MSLIVVSIIISHIIQFETISYDLKGESTLWNECGCGCYNSHIIHIEATFGKLEIRSDTVV